MLMDLTPSQTNDFMMRVFSGAHIRFSDNDAVYEYFCEKSPFSDNAKLLRRS